MGWQDISILTAIFSKEWRWTVSVMKWQVF